MSIFWQHTLYTVGRSKRLINLIFEISDMCRIKTTLTLHCPNSSSLSQQNKKYQNFTNILFSFLKLGDEWFQSCLWFWCMREANSVPFSSVFSISEVISSCWVDLLTYSCFCLEAIFKIISNIWNSEVWAHNNATKCWIKKQQQKHKV